MNGSRAHAAAGFSRCRSCRGEMAPTHVGVRSLVRALILLSVSASICLGQRNVEPRPAPLDPVRGEQEGRALVAEMLAQQPEQTMVPFAGSDFWVADLGLEFLHWAQQRVLRHEMRHSKACKVLESVNSKPAPGGYARVVSWVITDSPHGIVHADAYDARGERIKYWDPKNLEKVEGEYQLEEMEMRNRQTGSRTVIKFDLGQQ